MRHVPALATRELAAYFANPLAYLVLIAIQALAFFNFWQLLELLAAGPVVTAGLSDPLNSYLSASVQFWIAILFALPALTMRLVAEERRLGTIEPLLTAPVTETEVVLAKWLAGLVMYAAILFPYLLYLPFLYRYYPFDPLPMVSLGIGLLSIGAMFVAIGLFFSALTRNQIVAGVWTFAALFTLVVLTSFGQAYAAGNRLAAAEWLRHVSILNHVAEFGAGRLDLRHVGLHLSVAAFALFLAAVALKTGREG